MTMIMTLQKFKHLIQQINFRFSSNMHNFSLNIQNFLSNSHMVSLLAILHCSTTPLLLPISLVPIFMLISFMLISPRNFVLAISLVHSHNRNSKAKSDHFIRHLFKWSQRRVHLASHPNIVYVDTFHTRARHGYPSMIRLTLTIIPCVGAKQPVLLKLYVSPISLSFLSCVSHIPSLFMIISIYALIAPSLLPY